MGDIHKQWICFHEHTSEISEWTHTRSTRFHADAQMAVTICHMVKRRVRFVKLPQHPLATRFMWADFSYVKAADVAFHHLSISLNRHAENLKNLT